MGNPMHTLRGTVAHVALIGGLLVVCIWPAIYNGQPFLNPDTLQYIRYADAGIAKLTGHSSEWLPMAPRFTPQAAGQVAAQADDQAQRQPPFYGRSIYYGALLRLGDAFGLLWGSIAVQAAALMLAVALTLSRTVGFGWTKFAVVLILLSLVTPMAFYASCLMPDIFAGVTILGAANLMVYGGRMHRVSLISWIGLMCAALLFHISHVVVALCLVGLWLVSRVLLRWSVSWRGLAAILFSVIIAFAGEEAFTLATIKGFGVAPIRFPTLTARLVVDGPGAEYLKVHCPQANFALCRIVDRLPIATSHQFLWADAADGGVFTPADPDFRRALSNEQVRFFFATLSYDPIGVALAMLKDTVEQIGKFSMDDINYDDEKRAVYLAQIPPSYLSVAERTRAWEGTLPGVTLSAIVLGSSLASLAYLFGFLVFLDKRVAGRDPDLRRFSVIVAAGVLINAFVCGALSGPEDRYQARVIWLIPLLAGLIYLRRPLPLERAHELPGATVPRSQW
jgi:hypothetical protein